MIEINRQRRNVLSVCVAALLLFLSMAVSAGTAERDTVRIVFFRAPSYGYTGENGELQGYDIHLSMAIGMYAGFKPEMVGYDNVSEMEEELRTGKVDALIDFLRNDKREQEFIFTQNAILEEQVRLYTRNTPDAPTADQVMEIKSVRVGYISGAGYLDYFLNYCRELGIRAELKEYRDETAMNLGMEQGETDACLTGSAVPVGYRVLLSAPMITSYIMLRAEESELCRRIDMALSQLKTDEPNYLLKLYGEYVVSANTEMTALTPQEKRFLDEHPELTVALVRGSEPFTAEGEDGTLQGILPDYYRSIGKKLGITFHFIACEGTQRAIEAVKTGEADILGHFYGNIIDAQRDGLFDTMEYGTAECAVLTRSNFSGNIRTAAVTDRTAALLRKQLGPDIELKPCPNVQSIYDALMAGTVDAAVGSMTGISWLINRYTMRGVRLSVLPDIALGICGAVSDNNTDLLLLLNKAIAVSKSAMNEAILENVSSTKNDLRTSIENLPLNFRVAVVIVLAVLVLLLIAALVLLIHFHRERVKLLNREMNVDGLTGANTRRYGSELLIRELLLFRRYANSPMVAMFDIDYFKGKNDKYGHEYGDFVLKKVVEVLRGTLKKSDTIIRWGGDEFIVLCPRVPQNGGERLLEKMVRAVESADFQMKGKGTRITISVGASFFQQLDGDENEVLRRCDSALYEAKKHRNTYCMYDQKEIPGT